MQKYLKFLLSVVHLLLQSDKQTKDPVCPPAAPKGFPWTLRSEPLRAEGRRAVLEVIAVGRRAETSGQPLGSTTQGEKSHMFARSEHTHDQLCEASRLTFMETGVRPASVFSHSDA